MRERVRERDREKEGRKEKTTLCVYPYISPVITYLPGTLGYSGYFTLLYFASLYFFFLVECSKELHRVHKVYTWTYVYLLVPLTAVCIVYM